MVFGHSVKSPFLSVSLTHQPFHFSSSSLRLHPSFKASESSLSVTSATFLPFMPVICKATSANTLGKSPSDVVNAASHVRHPVISGGSLPNKVFLNNICNKGGGGRWGRSHPCGPSSDSGISICLTAILRTSMRQSFTRCSLLEGSRRLSFRT